MTELGRILDGHTKIDIAEQIDYYYQLQQEKQRLEQSLEIAKGSIMESFKYLGFRQYKTDDNILARVDTRVREFISTKEAKQLLDSETYKRLAQESVSVVLSVRKQKDKEAQDVPEMS